MITTRSTLNFLLLLISGLSANGCGSGDEYSPNFLFHTFQIFDLETGQNLYGWNGLYPTDSLTVFTKDEQPVDDFRIDEDNGYFYIPLINRIEDDGGIVHTKTFIIQLSSFDRDTIHLEYLFSKKGKCNLVSLETITASYNDSPYSNDPAGLYFEYYKK